MNADERFAFVAGLVLGILVILVLVASITKPMWRNEAVKRGYASYCPQNGEWAWKGECDNG